MPEGWDPGALGDDLVTVARAAAKQRRRYLRHRARAYERGRHLPLLLALPWAVRRLPEPAQTLTIIALLKRALRRSLALRTRRSWSWSCRRHSALLGSLGGELRNLRWRAGDGRTDDAE